MSSDHYATLGVSPSAESAVIRAAYRKLMRRYHPDANPDPEAHKRAQAITAAYAVLRNRAKRAKYDAERRDTEIWRWIGLPPQSARRPAGHTAGMAASMIAVLTVSAALLFLPRQDLVPQPAADEIATPSPKPSPVPSRPPAELQAESQRLADLSSPPRIGSPLATPPPKPVYEVRAEPLAAAPKSVPLPSTVDAQSPAKLSKAQVASASRTSTPPVVARKALPASAAPLVAPKVAEAPKEADVSSPPVDGERVASLQRISSGFYDQSLQNADTAKKQQLLNIRVRETYQRAACRSNSCVADSYLRQMRDVGAIMANRAPPPK